MKNRVNLKRFAPEELIYNKSETVDILKFIFKAHARLIDQLEIDNPVREFAQGLLVEAVDASYALGYIELLWSNVLNPNAALRDTLSTLARKASDHWFKHATAKDLREIKIYDIVIDRLAENFVSILRKHSSGIAKSRIGNSAYSIASSDNPKQDTAG